MEDIYNWFLIGMTAVAVVVFVALYFVDAGYGMFYNKKWGPSVPNKVGWVLMEAPVFFAMLILWLLSDRTCCITCIVFLLLFETHYFQRTFVFPFLMRGKSRMPFAIVLMGVVFNLLNACMQGGWIFFFSPEGMYTPQWLGTPQFIIGTVIFLAGMGINMHSDRVIRNLRQPGDTRHYFPTKGMYRYVTSANYFGEFVEWCGFAVLTWSWAGVVFAVWTFANLGPRAARIHKRYLQEFPDEMAKYRPKRIIPFIY